MTAQVTQVISALADAPDPATQTAAAFAVTAAASVLSQRGLPAELNAMATQMNAVATEVNTNTLDVAAKTLVVAANTALAATYANATQFSGSAARTIGDKRWSLVNGFTYIARTTGAASATDPANDGTNWKIYSTATPVQVVTSRTQLCVAGAAYAFTQSALQAAVTQYLLWSNDPSNVAWTKDGTLTVTTGVGAIMDPDGTMLGAKIAQSGMTGEMRQAFSASGTSTQTAIRYFKYGSSTSLIMRIYWLSGGTTQHVDIAFNPQTGAQYSSTASGATLLTHTTEAVGNGWYRVTVSGTGTNASNTQVQVSVYDSGNATYYYTYNGQATPTAAATSDIATTSVAVTRPANVVAPQRGILPYPPVADDVVMFVPSNTSVRNEVCPNGATIERGNGPVYLDNGAAKLQYIDGTWSFVK